MTSSYYMAGPGGPAFTVSSYCGCSWVGLLTHQLLWFFLMETDELAEPDALPTKTCTRCTKPQVLRAFAKRASAKDGLQSWCRNCVSSNSRQRRTVIPIREPWPYQEHL